MTNTYALDLAEFIAESILEKKGRDIKIINLGKKSDVTDYFVIATVESELDERKVKATGVDGDIKSSDWIVMDYFNVIVHLFKAETRQRYNIEGMWADAEITDFTEESVGK